MTAREAYESTTRGGATDFHRLIDVCESFGSYCLIGDFAVNCYVEPVYTLDADIVVIASNLPKLRAHLEEQGFKAEEYPHSVECAGAGKRCSDSVHHRYQPFPARATEAEVLGVRARVACLEDVTRGKLW